VPAANARAARVVYAAGVVQGIVLVTFPAASAIFTDPSDYGFSSSEYGAMFLPQALTAITFAVLSAGLARSVGVRRLYLWGLVANLAAMVLLLASTLVAGEAAAYPILLVATASLGMGFGLTVPAINTLTAAFHPSRVDGSVLVLNALLGLGTALAPVLVAVFVGLGFWWGLPLLSVVLLIGLLVVSLRLPLDAGSDPEARSPRPARARARIPRRFWVFATFALLYGICETMNGNWAQVDVTNDLGGSATEASLALTAFWASVTLGRIGFAAIQRRFPTRRTYHLLPFVLAASLGLIAVLPSGEPAIAVLAFALAGLGCSALLPLTITFGQEELVPVAASVAGGVIAFYQLGYGIAAFGAGPLQAAGVSLPTLFGITGIIAAALGGLAFVVARRRPEPRSLHPRPAIAGIDPTPIQGAGT
jgi:MFS family permease